MRLHRSWLLFIAVPPLLTVTLSLLAQGPNPVGPLLAPAGDKAPNKEAARRTPLVALVERVKEAVVNIHSERTVKSTEQSLDAYALAPSQSRVNGMGTGIIIDPRGYIVTNHHVIEDVNVLRIRLADGTTANAVVFARNPETDLALLKIDVTQPLPVMPLGTA